jgi:hypothetical protein
VDCLDADNGLPGCGTVAPLSEPGLRPPVAGYGPAEAGFFGCKDYQDAGQWIAWMLTMDCLDVGQRRLRRMLVGRPIARLSPAGPSSGPLPSTFFLSTFYFCGQKA